MLHSCSRVWRPTCLDPSCSTWLHSRVMLGCLAPMKPHPHTTRITDKSFTLTLLLLSLGRRTVSHHITVILKLWTVIRWCDDTAATRSGRRGLHVADGVRGTEFTETTFCHLASGESSALNPKHFARFAGHFSHRPEPPVDLEFHRGGFHFAGQRRHGGRRQKIEPKVKSW